MVKCTHYTYATDTNATVSCGNIISSENLLFFGRRECYTMDEQSFCLAEVGTYTIKFPLQRRDQ